MLAANLAFETHMGGEGLAGLPFGGGARSRLFHHLINLLEGQALGLGDEEIGVDESARAETTPDEKDGGLEVAAVFIDHVWGDNGNDLQESLMSADEAQIAVRGRGD